MIEMSVSEARARLADVVDDARVGREPVFLTRRGRRIAAVIDADQLERLLHAAATMSPEVVALPNGTTYQGKHVSPG
jgi:prevent-host-death family protein